MGFNILVVDDSKTTRSMIIKTLNLSGLELSEIFQAENGEVALDILKQSWIDLILTDLNMPVMNGIKMIEMIFEDEVLNCIPIIVVSTDGSATRIEEMKTKGVRAYLKKPFTPETIRDVVINALGVAHEG